MPKNTYIFTDAHQTGLGAILCQGTCREDARPVAFASRCTRKNYPQLDLEAMGIDYALRRFRNYLVGAPHDTVIVTDHHPLLSIFNGKRSGSIRTERIKMRHQDIRFHLEYQKASDNCADFMSRHTKTWETIPKIEKSNDLINLLYTLHISPVLDAIGIKTITEDTAKDPTLQKISKAIQTGRTSAIRNDPKLSNFWKIYPEITYQRMVLF